MPRSRERIEIAVRSLHRPRNGFGEMTQLGTLQLILAVFEQNRQTSQTEIIGPSLQQGNAQKPRIAVTEIVPNRLAHKRQIFFNKLGLKIACVGTDDHRDIVEARPCRGGDKIGQAFSNAGSRLDHQMPALVEGTRHGTRHIDLS